MEKSIIELVKRNHAEKAEIFLLAEMLDQKSNIPYYFNFDEEVKPTPFNHDGEDPETAVNWDKYPFQIVIDTKALSIMLEPAGTLEICNLKTDERTKDVSAEKAFEIISAK